MRVETAFCFRGWYLLVWVMSPELSPKADKSEMMVMVISAEDIGLPCKAQDPACGLNEIQYWGVFRVHWWDSPSRDLYARIPSLELLLSWAWNTYWEVSTCEMVVRVGCTEAQECWDSIVRYQMSLGNTRLGCKCLKQFEHSSSFFPPTDTCILYNI